MPLVRDLVIMFMRNQTGAVCASCLAKALRLSFDRLMDGWSDIRLRGDLPMQPGACSVCRAQTDVIGSTISA